MSKPEPRYPPSIELNGELLLDVFTHHSLRQEGGSGDNERYAVLGEKVFEASVTSCIFSSNPQFGRKEIEMRRAELLTDHNYEQWTKYYRLRDKLRFHGDAYDEVSSPGGAREIFHAYIGGAYTQMDGRSVDRWVHHLLVPPEERRKPEEAYSLSQPPPPSYPYPMQPPPPPPPLPPHQHSTYYAARSRANSVSSTRNLAMPVDDLPNGMLYTTSSSGKSVYLPRFNEITTQRRLNVEYPAEQTGLQHAPRWVVTCVVDGKQLGIGAATTKQLAKEEAAKQAYQALEFPPLF